MVRLRGKGVPILHTNRRGDQRVNIRVIVPEKLNEKQRKLLQELGDTLGMESLDKDNRSLFEKIRDGIGEALG
jgi:molecular chaperone DnaJ